MDSAKSNSEVTPTIGAGIGCAGIICFLVAAGIFVFQIFKWLYAGKAPKISFISWGRTADWGDWFWAPDQWIGVHKILSELPLSALFILVGLSLLAFALFLLSRD